MRGLKWFGIGCMGTAEVVGRAAAVIVGAGLVGASVVGGFLLGVITFNIRACFLMEAGCKLGSSIILGSLSNQFATQKFVEHHMQ